MFSKGVVLLFLILGLSSSIAHAIPCEDPQSVSSTSHSNGSQNTTTTDNSSKKAKPSDVSKSNTGKTATGTGNKTTDGGNTTKNSKTTTGGNTTTANGKTTTADGKTTKADGNTTTSGNNDTNTSLCLDKTVLSTGSESNGLNNATNGTSASLTSVNNFINFCAGQTITNGKQIADGSCNPISMGQIPSSKNMPSSKFVFPTNLATLKVNTAFTMKLAVQGIELGTFTNAQTNYFAAPQQVNSQGKIIGHTHLVVEQIESLQTTKPTDPTKFAFFKGVDNAAAADGTVSVDVAQGLPTGAYRFCTITTSANHAPANGPIAQHGAFEDCVYATVTQDGIATGNNNTAAGNNKTSKTAADGTTNKTVADGTGTNSTATGNKSADTTSKSANGKVASTTGKPASAEKSPAASPSPSPAKGGKGGNGKRSSLNQRRSHFSLKYRKD